MIEMGTQVEGEHDESVIMMKSDKQFQSVLY